MVENTLLTWNVLSSLEGNHEIKHTRATLNCMTTKAYLTVEDLQCIRDDRVLFEALNFTLTEGQLLQIEGHNGSGKTSLLRILCGLTFPTEGVVSWQGQDIQKTRSNYWASLLYVGHTSGIKADLTPLENLRMARTLGGIPTKTSLEEALIRVGLLGFEEVPTRTLSAGQQRRVALARLLLNEAQLWILDEPFTALDKTAIAHVEGWLNEHAQRGGIAVLTSHHPVQCEHTTFIHLGES